VELDLVDPAAVAGEGPQPRRVLVGLKAPAHRRVAPGRAHGPSAIESPAAALPRERLDERNVVVEQGAI